MGIDQKDGISQWAAQVVPCSLHTFRDLVAKSSEVIIFGSRAAGVHSPSSDLDVLVISPYKGRIRSSGLDCVVLAQGDVDDPFWLGSELASHAVQFGRWIKGTGEWRDRVCISHRAVARKRQRISALVRNGSRRWPRLHPLFRTKYAITTRRELQRLDLLSNRLPIPPTPILDSLWKDGHVLPVKLLELVDACGELNTLESVSEFRELALAWPSP